MFSDGNSLQNTSLEDLSWIDSITNGICNTTWLQNLMEISTGIRWLQTKLISLYKVSVSRITPPKSKDHELACWQLSKRELGMRKCKNTESTKHCSAQLLLTQVILSINLFIYYFKCETQRVRFAASSWCLQHSRENPSVKFGHREEKVQGREAPDLDGCATFSPVCCQLPECDKFHFLPAPVRVFMPRMQHRTASDEQVRNTRSGCDWNNGTGF